MELLEETMYEFLNFCRHFLRISHYVRGVVLVLLLALCSLSVVMSYVDGIPLGDALYFTLITGLTIGYGDIVPVTIAGRVLSVLTGLIGLIVIGIVVAVITRALSLAVKEAMDNDKEKE
jgi:voltage-gated potassium channel